MYMRTAEKKRERERKGLNTLESGIRERKDSKLFLAREMTLLPRV